MKKEIYIKTEPGGRVAFGKLNKTQEELFYKNYSKKRILMKVYYIWPILV